MHEIPCPAAFAKPQRRPQDTEAAVSPLRDHERVMAKMPEGKQGFREGVTRAW